MAGHCFITDAEGAQFHSQTSLLVIVCFLAFSVPDPLPHFKPIQTSHRFTLLFLKKIQKNHRELKTQLKKKIAATCKVAKLTETINMR